MPCQDIIKHIKEDAARRREETRGAPIPAPDYPMPKVEPKRVPADVGKEKEKAR